MDDYFKKLREVQDKKGEVADSYRGKILTAAIHVEDWLSTVIVSYFVREHKDRKERLKARGNAHYILIQSGRWDFNSKVQIVRRMILIEKYFDPKERSALIDDLQAMSKVRNKIAHWRLNGEDMMSQKFDGKTVVFSELKLIGDDFKADKFDVDDSFVDKQFERAIRVEEKLRELDRIILN